MAKEIVIFGATGVTGLAATEAALAKGLNVHAFVRDPTKLPETVKSKVQVTQGNVLNYQDVLEAVKGTDGVVVALGTRNNLDPTTEMSEGLKNIIAAMKEAGVNTVSVCLSAFLFFGLQSDRVPERMKDITAEHTRMYDVLKASDVNYVAVFPPHIADEPGTGYVVEHDKYVARRVSKYDLGQFLVDSLDLSEHYGKIVGIGSS